MLEAVVREAAGAWVAGWSIIQSHLRFGHNIYESEWDALLILDTCRVDALREVEDEYDFINSVESKWSIGSTSKEWLENTFVEEYRTEVEQTAYVSANSFARHLQRDELDRLDYLLGSDSTLTNSRFLEGLVKDDQLRADDFLYYESLWDKLIGDVDHREIHPEVVTDRAISAGREYDADRIIVHYMQPHHPYIYPDEVDDLHSYPFQHLDSKQGRNEVWEAYINNLRFVLDHVETLLENLDADTVVLTADHGELFGRWMKSHPVGITHPKLRKVPWVVTSASDTHDHEPDEYDLDTTPSEDEVMNRLADLGYV